MWSLSGEWKERPKIENLNKLSRLLPKFRHALCMPALQYFLCCASSTNTYVFKGKGYALSCFCRQPPVHTAGSERFWENGCGWEGREIRYASGCEELRMDTSMRGKKPSPACVKKTRDSSGTVRSQMTSMCEIKERIRMMPWSQNVRRSLSWMPLWCRRECARCRRASLTESRK